MGKKSGPLAFLNKKGWHPGNQRNQEKVWKKEQEAIAEKKQVEELRKQYDEARQKEEVEAMAVAAGVKKKQERLDWMYQGGMVAKQEAEKRADAQMLGEKAVDLPAVEEPSKAEYVAQLPAFYTQDTPASANEMWQKLHGDPMFAIKQSELAARKTIVANPVQMDLVRKRLKEKADAKAAKKAAKAEAKAAKKAARKAKKEKNRKRAKESSSSESDSEASEEDRSPKKVKGSNGQAVTLTGRRDTFPVAESDRHNDKHSSRSAKAQNGDIAEHMSRREYDARDRGYDRGQDRDRRHDRSHREHDSRRDSRDGRHESDQERRYDRSDRRGREESGRRERSRHENGHHRSRDDHRSSSPARAEPERRRVESGREERKADSEVKVYRDAASAQGRDLSYGLNAATNAAEVDREERMRETQKRLEEAKIRHEAEEKEKAGQRYKRKEHRTGQLSEEEKARRLAEMSGNADAHEEARWARLQAARKRDDSEAEAEALALQKKVAQSAQPGTQHHQDTAKFLQQATQKAFGGEDASLADRVSRRKYYNDRSRDESQGAFTR